MGYSKITIKIKRPCSPEPDFSPCEADSSGTPVAPEVNNTATSSEVTDKTAARWLAEAPTQVPSLFCANSQGTQTEIPVGSENLPLIDVQVTTSMNNERVKIDTAVSTLIHTYPASTFSYGLEYILYRDSTPLRKVSLFGDYVRQTSYTQDYDFHPNITFVDVPPTAGSYKYSMAVTERLARMNVDFIIIYNLGLTAIVFPPAPEPQD